MSIYGLISNNKSHLTIKGNGGRQEDDPSALVNMSTMWFVPQYALLRVAEGTHAVGHIEFFYALLPKSTSRIALAIFPMGIAALSLVVGILVFINRR